jgi:hypothetical protein
LRAQSSASIAITCASALTILAARAAMPAADVQRMNRGLADGPGRVCLRLA